MMGYRRVGASFSIFMSHGPRRRQMAHPPSWIIEDNLIKGLPRKVWAEFKESNKDGAAFRMSISGRP